MTDSNEQQQEAARKPAKERLWTPDFVILLGVSLCAFMSVQGLNNGTALYVAKLGEAAALAGAIVAVFSISAGVTRIALGRLLDRGSCRKYIVFGAICMFVGTAGAIVIPGVVAQFPLRALQGIGFSCASTASSKGASDVLPKSRIGEGVGYFGLGQSLGMAVGPPTAVALCDLPYTEAQFVGFSLVTALLILLAALSRYESHASSLPETCAYRTRVEQQAAQERARQLHAANGETGSTAEDGTQEASKPEDLPLLQSLFVKTALHGAIPTFFTCAGYALITSFASLYGTQLGIANPGLFFVSAAISMTIIRLAGGTFFDKVKPILLFIAPMVCGAIALAILFAWRTQIGFIVAGCFFGLNMGVGLPLLLSVCVKCTAPERWGSANALYFLAMDLGVGLSAIVWGAIIDASGYPTALLVGIGLIALTYVVAFFAFPRNLGPHGLE